VPGAPPPPSFFADLGVCRAGSLTCSHFSVCCAALLPFLKYVTTEEPPALLMGSAVSCSGSVLEPAGTGSLRCGGSPWPLTTEATPAVPHVVPKPCHVNLVPSRTYFTLVPSWILSSSKLDFLLLLPPLCSFTLISDKGELRVESVFSS